MKPPPVCVELDLAAIVRAHQTQLFRYLRFLGCERALAEDLVQETFLALLERPFEERGPAATAAYLRRVARNLYLMWLRRRSRYPAFEDLDAADRVWERYARDDGGEGYLEALRECLAHLKARARHALVLRFQAGKSRAEIGEALGLSEDGTKSILRRARRFLRECISRKIQ